MTVTMTIPTVSVDTVDNALGSTPAEECVKRIQNHGIKVCVFDMDQTAVAMHSRGRMKRGNDLLVYMEKATDAFKTLVPLMHKDGIQLAIATHSDEQEYGCIVQPATHILGEELARAMLEHTFTAEVASTFFVVAYNPRVQGTKNDEQNKIKRFHFRKIMEHFEAKPEEILFFDDVKTVVDDCNDHIGIKAIQVDESVGFQYGDLLNGLPL